MEERVKPVVIDDDHVDVVEPRDEHRWRIRPGILAMVVLGIFLASAAILANTARSTTPGSEPTALIDFTPRTPREHLDASDALVLVAQRSTAAWSISWDPVMNPPPESSGTIGLIPYIPDPEYRSPRFDAASGYVTNEECDAEGCRVRLAPFLDRAGTAATVEGTNATWHADEDGRFVWTKDGDAAEAWIATIDETGNLTNQQALFSLDQGEHVVRFDQAGYITRGAEIRMRDEMGEQTWSTDKRLVDATRLIVVLTDEGAWWIHDRADGSQIARLDGQGIDVSSPLLGQASSDSDGTTHRITLDLTPTGATNAASMVATGLAVTDGELRIYRSRTGDRITLEFVEHHQEVTDEAGS